MSRILLIDPMSAPMVERLRPLFPGGADGAAFGVVPTTSDEDLARLGADAEILLVIRRTVNARLLSHTPHARLVQEVGVGYDNFDLDALRAAGAVAANTPGANADAVAEHTILLMLALLKRLVPAESAVRQGGWPTAEIVQEGVGDLATATIGLVGFGNIGRAVVERLRPFGPQLLYTARHALDSATEQQLGARYVTLDDLLTSSTIVSLHLPLTEETRGLMGEANLAKMRAGALLINTARGELLDEKALHDALTSGKLAGAGLDVLRDERPGGNPFADLPQVIVTPHMAGGSQNAIGRMMRMAIANIERFQRGEEPLNLIPLPSAS